VARFELLVPGRSPAEVSERLSAQIAGPSYSEDEDPVRYHGAETRPGVFELRHYEWMATRGGGRVRGRFKYRAELEADAGGTRVRVRVDGTAALIVGAGVGFFPLLLLLLFVAAKVPSASPKEIENLAHGIPIVAVLLALMGVGVIALVRFSGERYVKAEQEFLADWLGAKR
jgi:hypothetical protein